MLLVTITRRTGIKLRSRVAQPSCGAAADQDIVLQSANDSRARSISLPEALRRNEQFQVTVLRPPAWPLQPHRPKKRRLLQDAVLKVQLAPWTKTFAGFFFR
jgi:hypothetical protein